MRLGGLKINISTPGDSAGPSLPRHYHFSTFSFHTNPPQLLKERGMMFLEKHPAHPIKVTEQGKEELRDFRRWKSTLSFGLGDLSSNLQLLILPDTRRAGEILHPGPAGCG